MSIFKNKSKRAPKEEGSSENGKPSFAVALTTQRHARKKMALGGAVESPGRSGHPYDRNPGTQAKKPDDSRRPKEAYMAEQWAGSPELDDASDTSMRPPKEQYMADHFAEGGLVDSIAEAVMQKMKAQGGMVDLEENAEEEPNQYYGMNKEAADAPQYDLDQLSPQPEDSNETGDEREDEESDKHDMVSAIRKKVSAKKGR